MLRDNKGKFAKGNKGFWLGKKGDPRLMIGKNHWNWHGDSVSYNGLHIRLKKKLGKAEICLFCGENKKRIEWASIIHKPVINVNSYIPLCVKCHRIFDKHPFFNKTLKLTA